MKYGLIGEKLGHSYSKIIHERIADYEYEIHEVARDKLGEFMRAREFCAINVTIPYKQAVIPYLYYISPEAEKIGAVNTIVNKDGRLYGYNTDIYGMTKLAEHAGISMEGKKVAVLGTGGTSLTAVECADELGALGIISVSRSAGGDAVSYEELYSDYSDVEIIINTTPVGMYPNPGKAAVDISKFPSLIGVLDAVYNPLRPRLVCEARERGIAAEGGLYMLVAQAVRAVEIFLDKELDKGIIDEVYSEIVREKENVVLIGMPASGKSSVGRKVAELLGKRFVDTDDLVREAEASEIAEIFEKHGEAYFRDAESRAVASCAKDSGLVIATGGGAVLRPENLAALRESGRIYFIDRPLELLMPTDDRPLSRSREAIDQRYRERYPIYTASADVHIDGDGSIGEVADRIIKEFCK